ncbi:MAG: glycerophosphodiester phosphodiesterase [Ruminococcaceae bacterium]|nr:glycerophosphodiester phosphodiesterase [Oscillospiraceae bacterium]
MVLIGIIVSLLVILIAIYLLVLVRPTKKTKPNKALLCDYAHRGLHNGKDAPENSLAAFEAACRAGYGIELDVQLSRDGTVMVFHDYTLIRMTGCDKKLSELDANELTALTLGESDQKIPTFEEVLSLVDGRVPLLVELKGENFDTSLCAKVADMLRNYRGLYCIESFNPLLIGNMKKQMPEIFCGLLYTNVCRDKKKNSILNIALTAMALNVVAKPDFIAFNKVDRDSLPVKITTQLFGAPKFVWTVNTPEELDTAHKNGELPIFENIF